VLLVFTQLCRSTRRKFLPWLWEHVQSLCVRSPGLNELECRRVARRMFRRQSRVLAARPSLAAHVRAFSAHLSVSSAPVLAKLLPLLRNLDTLEVLVLDCAGPTSEHSFKSVKLPQVRTLLMDSNAHYLMKSCTNAKRITIHRQGSLDTTCLNSIPFVANSLVYLALCLPTSEQIRDLVRLCPNLEELGIVEHYCYGAPERGSVVPECISAVQGLRKLRLLEVVLPCPLNFGYRHPRHVWESKMKEHAIAVLGNIRGHTKVLKMISVGSFYSWANIRNVETQIITVPA